MPNIDPKVWERMAKGDRSSGMTMDAKEFKRELKRLQVKVTPAGIIFGLGRAGLELMGDAIHKTPSVPLEEGTLRGSGSVFVNNELTKTSRHLAGPHGKPTPAISINEMQGKKEHVATIGFNTPYAARLHQHPEYEFNQDLAPGSGGKYLEYKLFAFGRKYFSIIVDGIRITFNKQLRRGTGA